MAVTYLLELSVRDAAREDAFNDVLKLGIHLTFSSLLSRARGNVAVNSLGWNGDNPVRTNATFAVET